MTDPSPELFLAIGVRRGSPWQNPGQGSDVAAIVSNGEPVTYENSIGVFQAALR